MRLKSAYREKPENNPGETPDIPQPSETTRIEFTGGADPVETTVAAIEPATPVDEATAALLKQLTELKKSEQLQREYAQHMAQQAQRPPSREEKLAAWRANGGDEGDISFLESHPEMIDRHDVTVVAAEEAAQQGFERGTPQHREATREIFHKHLAQAQPAPTDPAGFFRAAPEPTRSPAAPDRAAMYSAPVSRRDAGGHREPSPRQVKLSPLEQELARNLGLSDVQYAEGKIRLMKAKASGELQ